METFILWVGFAGAWLLFAGPTYQAAVELQEEDLANDRIKAAGENVAKPPRVSPWWWLLPPVKIYLEKKRSVAYQRMYIRAQLPQDAEAIIAFRNKAYGWMLVAVGGLCIAIKETYDLTEHHAWSHGLFWAITATMAIASIANTVVQLARSKRALSLDNE